MIALPCPWCGTDPGLAYTTLFGSVPIYQVGCEADECPCNPQVSAHSYEDAWARWNTRASAERLTTLEMAGAGGLK